MQPLFYSERILQAICGNSPPLGQIWHKLSVWVKADQAAVEILAGNYIGGGGSNLRVKVCGDLIDKPCKAVGAGAAASKGQHKCRSKYERSKSIYKTLHG